jgi:putative inorganic carbon (hco3(-)) transporter
MLAQFAEKKYFPFLIISLLISFVFVAILKEQYYLCAVPLIIYFIYLAIFKPSQFLLIIIFFTPFSLSLDSIELGGIGMSLPTEPMLFGLMLLYIIGLFTGTKTDKNFLKHPITIAIIIQLLWILITSITSTLPLVSFKFLVSRLWFVLVLYFFANQFFKNFEYAKKYIWAYIISFAIVIVYTVLMHASRNFSEEASHVAMDPFFRDHTSYGALLAIYFPIVIALFFLKKYDQLLKLFIVGLIIIFALGVVLSYTRAAWLSLAGAFALFTLIKLKIDFRLLFIFSAIVGFFIFVSYDSIIYQLEKNKQESSGNLGEHLQSVSNVSSDASNLERLNRWSCAYRMFIDKPLLGFGPGTYMFQYAPYQLNDEKTIITTNNADGGNAHSEYLGPLSEQGVFGLVFMLLFIGVLFFSAIRLYYKLEHSDHKTILLSIVLGLSTYFIHGVLNNYLDTDKASVPIWGFASIIVAMDLYYPKKLKNTATN